MNILMLTSVYPQSDDGTTVVTPTVKYFCDQWVKLGHNVLVVHNCTKFPSFFYKVPNKIQSAFSSVLGHDFPVRDSTNDIHLIENGVKVYRIGINKLVPYGKFSNSSIEKQLSKIENIIELNNFFPDVVVGHWVNPQIILLEKMKEKYKVKNALVFHNDCTKNNIERFDICNKIKSIDYVGCRNIAYAKYVKSALNLKMLPFICYSGIPDDLIDCQKENEYINRKFNNKFLYVGRLVKYKNVDAIIYALYEIFPDKNFILDIVGEGAELQKLKNLVKLLKLSQNVIFHKPMKRNQVFSMMKKSTYFIMISNNETFGMVYIEAMMMGNITIASIDGGVDGVIIDMINGFLTPQGNVEKLVLKMKYILSLSDNEKYQIRCNAIKTACQFKDSEVASRYIENISN